VAEPNGAHALTLASENRSLRHGISGDAEPVAIVPHTFLEVQSMSAALAESSLVPDKLRQKAADVAVILMSGAELGMPPMAALRLHHVIEGVPKLSADGIAARCTSSPTCDYLEPKEQSPTRVTWIAKRRGRPEQSLTWTIDEARAASLIRNNRDGSPGSWHKFPRQMLNARCKADLARLVWPDLVAGLVSAEEAWDGAIDVESVEIRGGLPASIVAPPAPTVTPPPTVTPAPPTSKAKGKGVDKQAFTPPPTTLSDIKSHSVARHAPIVDAESIEPRPAAPSSSPPPPPASDPPPPSVDSAATAAAMATPPAAMAPPPPVTDDGFGGDDGAEPDEPDDTPPEKTLDGFKAAVARAVQRKSLADLDAVKIEWVPWSLPADPKRGRPHPGEGHQHSQAMREIFARARAEIEGR